MLHLAPISDITPRQQECALYSRNVTRLKISLENNSIKINNVSLKSRHAFNQ